MEVFVIVCCDSSDNSILFIQEVFKDKQEAKCHCDFLNRKLTNQKQEIHFEYQKRFYFNTLK